MPDLYVERTASLPTCYVVHIEAHNGWEGDHGEDLGYVVIWDKETIQERWDAYEMADGLGDRWFPFGSDGGGEILCFDLRSGGEAVFWLPFVGMTDEVAICCYESFAELARRIVQHS